MIDKYFPTTDLVPALEESETMWFGSSLQYLMNIGLVQQVAEKTQRSFEQSVFENMDVNDAAENAIENMRSFEPSHGNVDGVSGSEALYNKISTTLQKKKKRKTKACES